jgi:Putative transposase of IS4/5 family (DUF4096)
MAKELVTDELWEVIFPLLPEEAPKPKGGRPRIDDRAALTGIIFVLKSGIPWERSSSDDDLVPGKAQDKPLNTRANLSLLRATRIASNGLLCLANLGAAPVPAQHLALRYKPSQDPLPCTRRRMATAPQNASERVPWWRRLFGEER